MSLLAIDIGSSACKAVAFSPDGQILARHSCAYTPMFPRPGHAEMAAEKFWDAVCECTRAVAMLASDISALCLSSHGESFVPMLGADAISPVILNQDGRAVAEASWISEHFGSRRLFDLTGLISHPMYPAAKILWLRKHRPELSRPGVRFVTMIGYILARLGLEPLVDFSLASRYLALDVRRRQWSPELVELIALSPDSLPPVAPAGTVAGVLGASGSSALGLPPETKVVLGGHDQPCSALGLGSIASGRVTDSMGTYECLLATSNEPDHSDGAFAASLNSYCHVVPDKFVTIAYFPSGIMLEWFQRMLSEHAREPIAYADLEAAIGEGPSGLWITPNLIGSCNPDFNPHARSLIFGLHTGSRSEDIYKGILEGIACEFARMARFLGKAAGEFEDVYVTGGGVQSKLGLRLRAAISGKQLHVMASRDAVCVGGAILAGVAAGVYRDLAEGVRHLVRAVDIVAPEDGLRSAYANCLEQYEQVCAALAPLQRARRIPQS